MKEKIETNGGPSIISESPVVVISNDAPEAVSIDHNGQVDPVSIEYNEYRDDLNKIYTTTSQENSLISKFVIDKDKCNHVLIAKYANGTSRVELSKEFEYNENFKENFLIPMLQEYNNYNSIFDDGVVVKENSLATFTARTKDNDSLIIENIDMTLASKLSDIVFVKDANNPNLVDSRSLKRIYDEKGIGNISVIILTALLIGITFIGTIFFTIMSNR